MGNNLKLDALRGLASLVVLGAHLSQVFLWRLTGEDSALAVTAGTLARHAVLVFFLLSGYLITGSIAANIRRNGRFAVGDYAAARIARIYPPLIGATGVALLAAGIIHGFGLPGSYPFGIPSDLYGSMSLYTVTGRDVWDALRMDQTPMQIANAPLWSLAIEFRLYIVAGLFGMAAANRKWRWAWIGAGLLWLHNDFHGFARYALCASVWGMGAAAALLSGRKLALAVVGLGVAGAALDPTALWQLAACLLYVWLIFRRPEGANPPRWMVASADYSYSLYVIHWPILSLSLALTQDFMGASWGRSLLVAGITGVVAVVTAYAFARVFERTAMFKAWLVAPARRLSQTPASPAASGRPQTPR